ncbi:MAG TPA: hypothetical protein PLF26_02040 [Blastocatellia bacterium]|nr:hypothetical protein [Blastocatellia bacterium]
MKTHRLLVAFLVAMCLAFSGSASFAQKSAKPVKPKEPPPDYFPLRVGDWWSYKSTTADGKVSEFKMSVLSEDTGVFLVEIQSAWPIQESYSKPAGWVMWHRESYTKNAQMNVIFDPPRQYLQNPLATGATWSWKGKGMMAVDIDETSQVEALDVVTVPAGTFKAMRVVSKVLQGGTTVTKTYWYANWIGLVKSMTDTGTVKSTTELVDYSFKKP